MTYSHPKTHPRKLVNSDPIPNKPIQFRVRMVLILPRDGVHLGHGIFNLAFLKAIASFLQNSYVLKVRALNIDGLKKKEKLICINCLQLFTTLCTLFIRLTSIFHTFIFTDVFMLSLYILIFMYIYLIYLCILIWLICYNNLLSQQFSYGT